MESIKNNLSHSPKCDNVRLTLIFDSMPLVKGIKTGWGFSCVAEIGETTLLFDTGSDGNILLSNMQKLGIDPKAIHIVMISRNRAGHLGGLDDFLKNNPNISVYFPEFFPAQKIEAIKKVGSRIVPVTSAKEIKPNVFTLGEFPGFFKEQALALRTSEGVVLITGCAHHGIIPIFNRIKEVLPKEPIYLALGGFHFDGLSDSEIILVIEAFRRLEVQKVAPCHCCKEECRLRFKKVYGDNYIEMGAGKVIQINSNKVRTI